MMDLINSVFELFASLFILNHCWILWRDKLVRGVSVLSAAFFFCWGLWNIFYYPSLGQSWSFYAGILVCLANAFWVGLMVYYKRAERLRSTLDADGAPACSSMIRERQELRGDISMTDFFIKSVRDEAFAVKPRKISKSEVAPLVTFGLIGLIGLGYIIFAMGAMWLMALVVVVLALMIPKIIHDRNERATSYSEYLSAFQDYQLRQVLDDAMTLGLDEETVSAIELHLRIGQKR